MQVREHSIQNGIRDTPWSRGIGFDDEISGDGVTEILC